MLLCLVYFRGEVTFLNTTTYVYIVAKSAHSQTLSFLLKVIIEPLQLDVLFS